MPRCAFKYLFLVGLIGEEAIRFLGTDIFRTHIKPTDLAVRENCAYNASREIAAPICHEAGSARLAWLSYPHNFRPGVLCG